MKELILKLTCLALVIPTFFSCSSPAAQRTLNDVESYIMERPDSDRLHLGVQNSSYLDVNPELFINGELQWEDESRKKIVNRKVINIRCDSEVQDSYFGL